MLWRKAGDAGKNQADVCENSLKNYINEKKILKIKFTAWTGWDEAVNILLNLLWDTSEIIAYILVIL